LLDVRPQISFKEDKLKSIIYKDHPLSLNPKGSGPIYDFKLT